jgi:hypothetical protein
VSQIAKMRDKDAAGNEIKRQPENFTQALETGIPGLRQNVPAHAPVLTPQQTQTLNRVLAPFHGPARAAIKQNVMMQFATNAPPLIRR